MLEVRTACKKMTSGPRLYAGAFSNIQHFGICWIIILHRFKKTNGCNRTEHAS